MSTRASTRTHLSTDLQKLPWRNDGSTASTSAMRLRPGLLTLMLLCLHDGLAVSFPALNCTKISLTGGNTTTRPSKSLNSDILMDGSHRGFQTVSVTPSDSEGLYTLTRNTSRFESRAGSPARTQHMSSARNQQRNDDLAYHSFEQSRIISDLHRRPEFYVPSSRTQLRMRPSSSHALQIKRPVSYQFADHRNTFYWPPGFDERKQEAGTHQIASRVYPHKVGPSKLKATPDMQPPTYEVSGGKPPEVMSSNIHEMSEEKESPQEMPTSGKMTHDNIDTDTYHDKGVYQPYDYHYDHPYDSYEYIHHTDLTEKPTTTPSTPTPAPSPPPRPPPTGHYRVGFKLYYIPLYAGMVFVAYVLTLIFHSIRRHKGQVPFDFLTKPPARMLGDDIAERVIRALEASRQRYNTRHK